MLVVSGFGMERGLPAEDSAPAHYEGHVRSIALVFDVLAPVVIYSAFLWRTPT